MTSYLDTESVRAKRYFLAFRMVTKERTTWTAYPAIPFRADGLLIWGADETTLIHRFQYGAVEALRASGEPIPALTFAAGISFEQFAECVQEQTLQLENHSEGILTRVPTHFAWQQISGRMLDLGIPWTFETSGPIAAVVSWGWGLTG